MTIGVFGLGRMGGQIARRLHSANFNVWGWNRSIDPVANFTAFGGRASDDIATVVEQMGDERVFWVMLPHGVVEDFLFGEGGLKKFLKPGDVVIDGGNSFYKDSIRRAEEFSAKGIHFYDAGTSGGVWGEKNGFALMVGGSKEKWNLVEPIFKTLSSGTNYGLLGKAGAGHFAKMVHNGIEYGMMEAIGEGYAVLNASGFDYNLGDVTRVYQEGSVIRSWLIDLTRNIFEQEDLDSVAGVVAASGEGEWTVLAGKELGVDVRVIEDSLEVRRESQNVNNQQKFSNKVVALLRKQFGGHGVVGNRQ